MIEDSSMHATHSKDYDIESIMHYDPADCPLAKWADSNKQKEEIIEEKPHYPEFKITDLDAEAIKILYPWKK
jgi:hypothetical protein